MMGLLDTLLGDTPDRQAQMGLLFQGLAQRNGVGGLLAANQYAQQAPDRKRAQEMDAMRMQLLQAQVGETQAQGEERKANAAKQQALLAQQARLQAGIPGLFRQPGMTGGEPQPQMQGGVPMFSQPMGAAPMQSTPGGFDVQAAIRLGMDPKMIAEYAGLTNIGRPEVARTLKGMKDGREVETQYDKYGQPIGDGLPQYRAPISVNRGNSMDFLDPFNLKPQASLKTFQSPDSVASNAVTMRGQNMTDARSREANTAGRVPAGYRANPDGTLAYIPGGPADPARNGEKVPSEGERKAATLLMRLQGSQAQLTKALKDDPGAAKPELFPSAVRGAKLPFVGGIPGAEPLANVSTSQARQQVESAQLDMLDAALTLGTGAAYTREQLEGYRKSFFPQIGDSPKTVADKQDRLQNVIEAAKIAAGRATPPRQDGADAGWEIREVK
jgi:hypothetical protein